MQSTTPSLLSPMLTRNRDCPTSWCVCLCACRWSFEAAGGDFEGAGSRAAQGYQGGHGSVRATDRA
eukprot:1034474-Pelagomonas_calceolata.AAC.5